MRDKQAIELAKEELARCLYLLDFGYLNPGLQQIYSKRAGWISMLIYIAENKDVKEGEWKISEIPCEEYVCSECGGAAWYYDEARTIQKKQILSHLWSKDENGVGNGIYEP